MRRNRTTAHRLLRTYIALCMALLAGLSVNLFDSPNTVSAATGLPQYVDEYDIPSPNSAPLAITVDKHGLVWFTESNASKLGRFDPTSRTFKDYQVPWVGDMWGVAVDEEGDVWFTQYAGKGSVNPGGTFLPGGQGRLVRFDPSNETFSFVDIPTVGSFPMRLTLDSQGRIWFTEFLGNKIGVYDKSSNQLAEYDVPTNSSGPADLTFDQRGTLWFTEAYGQKVVKFFPENRSFTEYSVGPEVFSPVGIAVDHDGHTWFADHGGSWIAEFSPNTQKLVRYPTHFPPKDVSFLSIPNGLLIDRQSRVWFTEHGGNSIAYFDPKTQIMVEFPIPTGPISTALWIALAPNGDVWFTEWDTNKIGVVHANLPVPLSLRLSQNHIRVQAGEQTSLSLLTKTSRDIGGNGTFRYSWTSYNPEEISVTFSPQYPTFSGLADTPARAELKVSDSVRPSNFTLGLGIDAGRVRVWSMAGVEVVSAAPNYLLILENPTVLILVGLLPVIVVVAFLARMRSRKDRRAS